MQKPKETKTFQGEGEEGRGLLNKTMHDTHMYNPHANPPYVLWHNIAWKRSTFTMTNIPFPTSFVSKTTQCAQPRETHW